MELVIDVLKRQIQLGENLLKRVEDIPDSKRRFDIVALGYVPYDKEITQALSLEADAWEVETKEYLIEFYGEESRQYKEFCVNIRPKEHYVDFREELKIEISHCISYLNTIIKMAEMKKLSQKNVTNENNMKPYKLFISHATEDNEFVNALVTLFEGIGFNKSNMFCSSFTEYGIGLSENIFQKLRSLFEEYKLYVIFVHSPRYYKKAITLNEMGAAWVLRTKFCSILTNDMEFDKMVGVVNNNEISIKIDDKNSESRFNELKNILTNLFKLEDIDMNIWERKRNEFLEKVRKIKYED